MYPDLNSSNKISNEGKSKSKKAKNQTNFTKAKRSFCTRFPSLFEPEISIYIPTNSHANTKWKRKIRDKRRREENDNLSTHPSTTTPPTNSTSRVHAY